MKLKANNLKTRVNNTVKIQVSNNYNPEFNFHKVGLLITLKIKLIKQFV
jgi:hypothetical protein